MLDWQYRTSLLIGEEGLRVLGDACVAVVGLGGVGAYAAEMLVRAGVGHLLLVDSDSVSVSNLNRQLIALRSTVGLPKTEVLAARLLDINPDLDVVTVADYLTEANVSEILNYGGSAGRSGGETASAPLRPHRFAVPPLTMPRVARVPTPDLPASPLSTAVPLSAMTPEDVRVPTPDLPASPLSTAVPDLVIDAIDTLSPKIALIQYCLANDIRLVSSMGSGAKTDATKVKVADISKTRECPLAHQLRKRLHRLGIFEGFQAVYSEEKPRRESMVLEESANKKSQVGTISYLPAVFGCICAQAAIGALLGKE